mgnify:CR=1 FL=1
MGLDLRFGTPNTDFKHILSLVPAALTEVRAVGGRVVSPQTDWAVAQLLVEQLRTGAAATGVRRRSGRAATRCEHGVQLRHGGAERVVEAIERGELAIAFGAVIGLVGREP